MNELDRKIQEALRKEDAELFREVGDEPSIVEMVMDTFRGRTRFLSMIAVFWGIVFMVCAVLSVIKFLQAEATRDLLMWATIFIACMLFILMMKLWYFMEMNKNAVTREVKRVELQIARLASRIKE